MSMKSLLLAGATTFALCTGAQAYDRVKYDDGKKPDHGKKYDHVKYDDGKKYDHGKKHDHVKYDDGKKYDHGRKHDHVKYDHKHAPKHDHDRKYDHVKYDHKHAPKHDHDRKYDHVKYYGGYGGYGRTNTGNTATQWQNVYQNVYNRNNAEALNFRSGGSGNQAATTGAQNNIAVVDQTATQTIQQTGSRNTAAQFQNVRQNVYNPNTAAAVNFGGGNQTAITGAQTNLAIVGQAATQNIQQIRR